MTSSYVRELLAGTLIKLAHRIFPPTVTEYASGGIISGYTPRSDSTLAILDGGGYYLTDYEARQRAQRLESRGWN